MNPALYAAFRSLVQGAVSWLFAHFVILGQFTDVSTAVDWTLTTVVLAGYVWLANWLGSRTGDGQWPRLARLAARVLMLGMSRTPSYPTQSQQ